MIVPPYSCSHGKPSIWALPPKKKPPDPEPTIAKTNKQINDHLKQADFHITEAIKLRTFKVLQEPPGENDRLWQLLRELVLDPDPNGNPRFMP